ncbi:MAG TPA: GTP cyclohydrolase I, partial [Candidatus Limnocylindrales bacterium]|nr:GTP cyclohydrolase I [Candidatus Limnocylindrales bacterium]
MTERPELPDHVRRLVDAIEHEIGDDEIAPGVHAGDGAFARPGGIASSQLDQPAAPVANSGIEAAVRRILTEIGEDPDREGLVATPDRVHRMYHELTAGYHVDPDRLINRAIFDVAYSEMVVVKDIP